MATVRHLTLHKQAYSLSLGTEDEEEEEESMATCEPLDQTH
jgi:hypothetical protein